MSFPRSYRGIRELIRSQALRTPTARAIARRSGIKLSAGGAVGTVPTQLLSVYHWIGEVPLPTTYSGERYSVTTDRLGIALSLGGQSSPVFGSGFDAAIAQLSARVWLGGFSQVRVCARVRLAEAGVSIFSGFAIAGELRPGQAGTDYRYMASARFPDTADYVLAGGAQPLPGTGVKIPLTPLGVGGAAYYAVGEWMDLHEDFQDAEVDLAIWIHNSGASGFAGARLGICEIQAR